ncbi:hypothetical protein BHYA_0117g00170 [Botrytis hyacinthi]|uniref:Uncharacterized protein n=1 Tax=Botrytis hyacinthi TaxID=278943 RepID=A0A4Z1GSX8_9HELO|nr:hypothetical protein BHYA_0117g00170 [Botrytis hyacinthi]
MDLLRIHDSESHTHPASQGPDNDFYRQESIMFKLLEHHGADEVPGNDWKQKWFKSLFNGNWNSSIKPTPRTIMKRQGAESAIVAGTLRVDCPQSVTGMKRSRAQFEEQDSEAPVNADILPVPAHRRCGSTVACNLSEGTENFSIPWKSRLQFDRTFWGAHNM